MTTGWAYHRDMLAQIRDAVLAQGVTTASLSIRTGLCKRTIERVLSGRTFRHETMAAVAESLGLEYDEHAAAPAHDHAAEAADARADGLTVTVDEATLGWLRRRAEDEGCTIAEAATWALRRVAATDAKVRETRTVGSERRARQRAADAAALERHRRAEMRQFGSE